jgi:hypothetical protein
MLYVETSFQKLSQTQAQDSVLLLGESLAETLATEGSPLLILQPAWQTSFQKLSQTQAQDSVLLLGASLAETLATERSPHCILLPAHGLEK